MCPNLQKAGDKQEMAIMAIAFEMAFCLDLQYIFLLTSARAKLPPHIAT